MENIGPPKKEPSSLKGMPWGFVFWTHVIAYAFIHGATKTSFWETICVMAGIWFFIIIIMIYVGAHKS